MIEVALRHHFPGLAVDIAFAAPTPGTTVLFGPSGSGKSTTVAAIAGLLRPDHTRIVVDGEALADTDAGTWLPPERRRLGMVFQEPRLFPHLRIDANLRYGQRRAPPGTIRFDDVVALLGIGGLLDRRPHTLSGGERQRVAIGRALLSQPRLLLMDEPLANLDAARKAEILPFLVRLGAELALPIVYVTHALDEVVRLADTLVLLESGRVTASGPLSDIVSRSQLPLAARDDAAAVFAASVVAHHPDRRLTELARNGMAVLIPLLAAPIGTGLRLRIPARDVILANSAPSETSVHNAIAGIVRAIGEDAGRHAALVEVAVGDTALLSRVTPDAIDRLRLAPGQPVIALVKSVAIEVLNVVQTPVIASTRLGDSRNGGR